jgi:hypothetical protein
MYSYRAEDLRRCLARTKAGQPCRQWAMWGDSQRGLLRTRNPENRRPGRDGDAGHRRTTPQDTKERRRFQGLSQWSVRDSNS